MKKPKHIHGPNIFDPNCASCRRGQESRSTKVNRHLLAEDDPAYLPEFPRKRRKPKYGYHSVKIKRGTLGEISKIQEEVDELKDAEKQGVRIMVMCELADIIGAVRSYAMKYGLTINDLCAMEELTRNAFETGRRE